MQERSFDQLASAYETVADLYEAGRPTYPAEAIDLLVSELGIDAGAVVMDLGAGTGKLTRLLVQSGARVVAVEPIFGMCRVLQRQVAGAEVVGGAAGALPFVAGSFNVVTAAQAFQWFARSSDVSEIRRVLRPGGGIGLIWNRRDRSAPVWKEIEALIAKHRPAGAGSVQWRAALAEAWFTPLRETTITFDHGATADQVALRVASMSWVAALPTPTRLPLLQGVRDAAHRHATDGVVELRENTEVVWGRR